MHGERGRSEGRGRLTYSGWLLISILANVSGNGQYFQVTVRKLKLFFPLWPLQCHKKGLIKGRECWGGLNCGPQVPMLRIIPPSLGTSFSGSAEWMEWFCKNVRELIFSTHTLWWLSLSWEEKPMFYKVSPLLCSSPFTSHNLYTVWHSASLPQFLSRSPSGRWATLSTGWLSVLSLGCGVGPAQSECFLQSSCCVSEWTKD